MERVPRDDGHHDVELELPGVGRREDRGVAAEHLKTDLVDHLGDRRVHLAGHDRRARLHGGQLELRDSGARSHAEKPQVRRDLADFHRQSPQRTGTGEHVSHALGHAEAIGRRPQAAAPSAPRDWHRRDRVIVAGIQPGADGCRAKIQLEESLPRALHLVAACAMLAAKPPSSWPSGDRHRVLQVRASRLQHVRELGALLARVHRRGRARSAGGPAASARSASRVAVGYTSFVDCPMLT